MNTKLNKSDYVILAVFYVISAAINILDYYQDQEDLIEYLIDIPMFMVTSFLGVLIFMYFIIPSFLVKKKNYLLFAFWGLITVSFIGIIERITGFLSSSSAANAGICKIKSV